MKNGFLVRAGLSLSRLILKKALPLKTIKLVNVEIREECSDCTFVVLASLIRSFYVEKYLKSFFWFCLFINLIDL